METNEAIESERAYQRSRVELASEQIEKFDILETITNVGNDEVFTPVNVCRAMLDLLPDEVWHNKDYRWLNPCDKNGVFLREIAWRLNKGLEDVIPDEEERKKHILQDMLFSIGHTKFTALVSRRTLYYCVDANRKPDGKHSDDNHVINGYAIGEGTWFDTAEGNVLNPIGQHSFDRNGKCTKCNANMRGKNGNYTVYGNPNQNENYAYEFIHAPSDDLLKYLQQRFKGGIDMKFDIIIGNPPYHLNDGGGGTGSSTITLYNLFVEQAKLLNPKYLCFIIPSRWMTGGKGLNNFRNEMIHDKHILVMHDYIKAKNCFPDIELPGGVCYFLRDSEREGKCEIYTHEGTNPKNPIHTTRYLVDNGDDVFVRFETLLDVKNKVASKHQSTFMDIVSQRGPYGIGSDFFTKNASIIKDEPFKNCLTIVGYNKKKGSKDVHYIENQHQFDNYDGLNKYKVFVTKSYGSGGPIGEGESTLLLSEPFLGKPGEICTESYLQVGPFETLEEAKNCLGYIKTKFFRAMLGIRKQTQNAPSDVYKFVPKIDLNRVWTDKELYDFYGLNDNEREFIEKHIREMGPEN